MRKAGAAQSPKTPKGGGNMKAKKSPHVPGQLFGYSLQTTRATVRLLEGAQGSFVSVEVFDDVGVEVAGGEKVAEQTKAAETKNPIADRSIEFWKTISNWLTAIETGEILLPSTRFELYISKKRSGAIAESFAAAGTSPTAKSALLEAKVTLWGPEPKYAERKKVALTLAPFLDHVFGADEEVITGMIERFSLSFGKGDAISEIETLIAKKIVSPEMRPTVVNQMLGWTKATIDRLLEQKKLAVVAVDDFNRELSAFVQKYDRNKILYSFAPEPLPEVVAAELPTRTYIRQLDLIDLDYEDKLRAANDFLRASLDRSIWSEKGLVHKSSFDEFRDQLQRTWSAKRLSVGVQAAGKPHPDIGRQLYGECILVKHELEATEVPAHFTPGCFHALAEDQTVGWHPGYKEKLANPVNERKS
jgi:hypothetical protein